MNPFGSNGTHHAMHRGSYPCISQQSLRQYSELKRLAEQKDALRKHILELLQTGAHVEPGLLQAEIRSYEQRLLNAKSLLPLLGQQGLEDIRKRVEPTVVSQLWVF